MTMNSGGSSSYDKRRSSGSHYHRDRDGGGGGGGGGGHHDDGSGRGGKYDDPPNSRLFIVCGKQITEDQFREAFGPYGHIEEVWVLKDRVTGEPKGVTYIKFSKTSEAALAMEEMNGKCINGSPRPMKVLIAHSRDQGSRRDMNEDERLVRLFVVVPKTISEPQLKEHFSTFGDIDYVSIVRDRNTKESKGFAYVKYHRMSHAAKAFEECERTFKPVFADPKPQKSSYHEGSGGGDRFAGPGSTASGSTSASLTASYDMISYMDTSQSNPEGLCRLQVSVSSAVSQTQLWRLFDLVPGLDYCDRPRGSSDRGSDRGSSSRSKGYYMVVYNNPQSAAYAKEKLNQFEYPPGQRMYVKFDYDGQPNNGQGYSRQGYSPVSPRHAAMPPPSAQAGAASAGAAGAAGGKPNFQNDLAHLTETIANATALLQAAGYSNPSAAIAAAGAGGSPAAAGAGTLSPTGNVAVVGGETYDPSYCSVKLPSPQPLAAMDSDVAERLFIVCSPLPPQLYALKDVFGRFGNLIDIYMLNGKTCGYAKYADKESADKAVAALHGQEICGTRLKVMPADPQDKSSGDSAGRKRPKISDGDQ